MWSIDIPLRASSRRSSTVSKVGQFPHRAKGDAVATIAPILPKNLRVRFDYNCQLLTIRSMSLSTDYALSYPPTYVNRRLYERVPECSFRESQAALGRSL